MPNDDQHQFKDRYMLRLPDGMRDRIKAAAESNNRSMNAEIVAVLERAYPFAGSSSYDAHPDDPVEQWFAELLGRRARARQELANAMAQFQIAERSLDRVDAELEQLALVMIEDEAKTRRQG